MEAAGNAVLLLVLRVVFAALTALFVVMLIFQVRRDSGAL